MPQTRFTKLLKRGGITMIKKNKIVLSIALLAWCLIIAGLIGAGYTLNEENRQLTKQVDEYEQKALDWQIKAEDTEIKLAKAETDLQSCSEQIEKYEQTIYQLEERIKELEDEIKALEEVIEISNTPSDWDYEYTERDVLELGAMIFAEEEGDSFCAAGAGSVAGNRVRRPDFPNTIHDVIYQIIETEEHTYEQYAPRTKRIIECVVTGKPIPRELADVSYIPDWYYNIARLILEYGPIFPKDVVYQAHFKQGKGVYYEKDGEFFCYG